MYCTYSTVLYCRYAVGSTVRSREIDKQHREKKKDNQTDNHTKPSHSPTTFKPPHMYTPFLLYSTVQYKLRYLI